MGGGGGQRVGGGMELSDIHFYSNYPTQTIVNGQVSDLFVVRLVIKCIENVKCSGSTGSLINA